MIYTIDSGNQYSRVGIFSKDNLMKVVDIADISLPDNEHAIIYSSVGRSSHFFGKNASDFFRDGYFLNMPVHYTQELGTDRLVLGHYFFKGQQTLPTIVIDAGTFITIDFITSEGFTGGMILPGIDVYLDYFSKASRIPVLSKEEIFCTKKISFPGQSTQGSIASGFQFLIEGIFDKVCSTCMPKNIYLTGGNGDILQKFLPKSEFNPYFIHFSLKRILQMSYRV